MNPSRSIHEQLYLGLDGGASQIGVALVNNQGKVVHEQTVELGANHHELGVAQVVENIEQAVQEVIATIQVPPPVVFDYAYLGLSGVNFPSDIQTLVDALKYSPLNSIFGRGFTVINDSQLALKAGLPETDQGMVLLAGTGSNCVGLTNQGRLFQSGGWDHILADEGSGYDIGLRTLKAVTRSLDGRGEATKLSQAVMQHLQVHNLEQLHDLVYRQYTTKKAIATLAKLTERPAEEADHVAQSILNHSVNELLKMVDAVMTELEWRNSPTSLVLVGSTILENSYMRRRFEAEVRRINPQTRTTVPEVSSASAAAHLAQQSAKHPS